MDILLALLAVVLLIISVVGNVARIKKRNQSVDTDNVKNALKVEPVTRANKAIEFNQVPTQSAYSDYSRFIQKWDESYDIELGYEWFRICVEHSQFPIYKPLHTRLYNIRKGQEITQIDAAKDAGISTSTLSSYENGYTIPSENNLKALSDGYGVPFCFLKYGYLNDFREHIKYCQWYSEDDYLHSLRLSITAASRLFPDMLTTEDKATCVLVNDILNMRLDLFNEKAIAQEKLRKEIRNEIIETLNRENINQSKLYASHADNRSLTQSVVKELYDTGIISKEKNGNTYILKLIK